MTPKERETMAKLVHYAEWTEKLVGNMVVKHRQFLTDLHLEIICAKGLLEADSHDA